MEGRIECDAERKMGHAYISTFLHRKILKEDKWV